jgi:hypothetical protein
MADHLFKLEGGRYDGHVDEFALDFWPPLIWAWNCPGPKGHGCKSGTHVSIVPGELVDEMLREAHERGVYPELYEKDRLGWDDERRKILMIYVQSKMTSDSDDDQKSDLPWWKDPDAPLPDELLTALIEVSRSPT